MSVKFTREIEDHPVYVYSCYGILDEVRKEAPYSDPIDSALMGYAYTGACGNAHKEVADYLFENHVKFYPEAVKEKMIRNAFLFTANRMDAALDSEANDKSKKLERAALIASFKAHQQYLSAEQVVLCYEKAVANRRHYIADALRGYDAVVNKLYGSSCAIL